MVRLVRIEVLGFDGWFRERFERESADGEVPARVCAVHRERLVVRTAEDELPADLAGRLLQGGSAAADPPVTGDWVRARLLDRGVHALVTGLLPRRTVIARKGAGGRTALQPLAANVDVALLVQSMDEDFSPRRLERYLAVVREGGVRPVILLSKRDLVSGADRERYAAAAAAVAGEAEVLPYSASTGEGVDEVRARLAPARTCCLLGSSGVGKTTLINRLLGAESLATAPVRDVDHKGRHVTTTRQLVVLDGGALLIDTPGMREIGVSGVEAGIEETFADVAALARGCRYRDCSHDGEEGCAVEAAVLDGALDAARHRSYLRLRRESARNRMSLAERRRKDRSFGRMCKSVMKERRRRRGAI